MSLGLSPRRVQKTKYRRQRASNWKSGPKEAPRLLAKKYLKAFIGLAGDYLQKQRYFKILINKYILKAFIGLAGDYVQTI